MQNIPDRIEPVGRHTLMRAIDIWKNAEDKSWIRPFRLYARTENGTIIAADNTDGSCLVRVFSSAGEAIRWLEQHERESELNEVSNGLR